MARTKHGLPGIYNATPITLTDGQGAAIALDSSGRLVIAPLSSSIDEISTIQKPITTSTPTNVASSATSVQLLAANANRRAASIFNDSTQDLYIKEGTTASATDFLTIIPPKSLYEFPLPIYTGRVDGIWAAANGSARIVEKV